METLNTIDLMAWRATERLLIVAVGALCIYLGYRLFWSMREFKSNNEGKIELPGGVSIHLSRVGPGVFFALFGALIIGTSIVTPLNITPTTPATDALSATAQASISYASNSADVEVLDQERAAILRDMDALASAEPALTAVAQGEPFGMAASDATRLLIALPHIRRSMLLSVWNPDQWGSKEGFVEWIENGQTMPPPEQLRIPAQLLAGHVQELN